MTKKYLIAFLVPILFLVPSVSFAAALTTQQSNSLIAVVQSSPNTPASAFVSLITAFSNITVNQATSLITVVQAAPSVPASAFVDLLTSFTVDTTAGPTTQAVSTPIATAQPTQTNQQVIQPVVSTSPISTTQTNQPTIDIKANGSDGPITIAYGMQPTFAWTTKGMFGCTITNSWGGSWTGNHDNTSGTLDVGTVYSDYTITVKCNVKLLPNGDMVNSPASDSVIINIDPSTIHNVSATLTAVTESESSVCGKQTSWVRSAGAQNACLGSFTFSASSMDGIDVNTIAINLSRNDAITNLTLKDDATGAILGTIIAEPSSSNWYNVNLYIPKSSSRMIDVYGDILSSASAGTVQATVGTGTSGMGRVSGISATVKSAVPLQTVTIQ